MGRRSVQQKAQETCITEAIGYIRVSTAEQADSGLSLEAQQARIQAYCAANEWKLKTIYTDAGVSAKTLDRPALKQALTALKPGCVLVGLKLDRLTRSVRDLHTLTAAIEEAGAEWACVQERFDTTTATGRLMLNLIVELSQWEREVTAERTSAALMAKRARGERLGTTPLGFNTVRTSKGSLVELNLDEQLTVRMARNMREEGLTLREIADRLTESGRPTKRGGRWQPGNVALLLKTRYIEEMKEDCEW